MCVLSFEWKRLLTFWFQKELAKDGNGIASTIYHNVVNNGATVSNVRNDAMNTPTIVSDIHRNTLKMFEGTRGQDPRVSTIRTLLVTE